MLEILNVNIEIKSKMLEFLESWNRKVGGPDNGIWFFFNTICEILRK